MLLHLSQTYVLHSFGHVAMVIDRPAHMAGPVRMFSLVSVRWCVCVCVCLCVTSDSQLFSVTHRQPTEYNKMVSTQQQQQ